MPKKPLPPVSISADQTLEPLKQVAHATVQPIHELILDLARRGHGSYVLLAAAQLENALKE